MRLAKKEVLSWQYACLGHFATNAMLATSHLVRLALWSYRVALGSAGAILLWSPHARAEVLVRISDSEHGHGVVADGNAVWFASASGSCRVVRGRRVCQLQGRPTNVLAEVRGDIWAGSAGGLFRLPSVGMGAIPILTDSVGKRPISAILATKEAIWVGSQQGLFRAQDETGAQREMSSHVRSLALVDGKVWVATSKNLKRIGEKGPRDFFDEATDVEGVYQVGGQRYVLTQSYPGTFDAAYKFEDDRLVLVTGDPDFLVGAVAEVDGEVWYGTYSGVFRITDTQIKQVDPGGLSGEVVNAIVALSSEVLVGTSKGVYRWRDTGFERLAPKEDFGVEGLVEAAGQVWFWGDRGVYRIDNSTVISFGLNTFGVCGIKFLFGRRLYFVDVRYDDNGADPYLGYDPPVLGEFAGVISVDRGGFVEARKGGGYSPVSGYHVEPGFGVHSIRYSVRDQFGNVVDGIERRVICLPVPPMVWRSLAVLVGWLGLGVFLVVVAPWSRICLYLVCGPGFFRKTLAVSIALSLPAVRRRLLRVYIRRELRPRLLVASPGRGPGEWPEKDLRVEMHDYAFHLRGHRLAVERYLRHQERVLAKECTGRRTGPRLIPIYIRLVGLSEEPGAIEARFVEILRGVGLTSLPLNQEILNDGGFVFLIEFPREASSKMVDAVDVFCDLHRRGNSFVVGSSSTVPCLRGFECETF